MLVTMKSGTSATCLAAQSLYEQLASFGESSKQPPKSPSFRLKRKSPGIAFQRDDSQFQNKISSPSHTQTVKTTLPDVDSIDRALEELITEEMNAKGLSLDEFVRHGVSDVKAKETQIDQETHTESNLKTRSSASGQKSDVKHNLLEQWHNQSPRRITKTLLEGLDFINDFLLLAKEAADMNDDDHEFDLESIAQHLSNRTSSIAFAGVGAHDIVDRLFALTLSNILGRRVDPPRSLWHIEYNSSCQQELLLLHDPVINGAIYKDMEDAPCLFGDIHTFWRPEIIPIIDSLKKRPSLACEVLGELLITQRAVRLSGWCIRHGRHCRIRPVDRHSTGNVCTAYSSQGLQLALNDPSVLSLLCWNLGLV